MEPTLLRRCRERGREGWKCACSFVCWPHRYATRCGIMRRSYRSLVCYFCVTAWRATVWCVVASQLHDGTPHAKRHARLGACRCRCNVAIDNTAIFRPAFLLTGFSISLLNTALPAVETSLHYANVNVLSSAVVLGAGAQGMPRTSKRHASKECTG